MSLPDYARIILATLCAALTSMALTACRSSHDPGSDRAYAGTTPILLFTGTGTSSGDIAALEEVLGSGNFAYSRIDSRQLNGLSASGMREHRLLIVPGGNFEDIGNGLTSGATANIRDAVQNGLNYLGICAGAFFAGNSPYNGLNLTAGVRFWLLWRGRPGNPQGSRRDYRCGWANARSVLGGTARV